MSAKDQPTQGEGGAAPHPLLEGRLWRRAVTFTIIVMTPLALSVIVGPEPWLLFALVGGTVAAAGDAGGPALERLGWMALAPSALIAGMALGWAVAGDPPAVLLLSMAAGLVYGLVETAHPHLLLASRFFVFGIVLTGLIPQTAPADFEAIALMLPFSWGVSVAVDGFRPSRRALSVPNWHELVVGAEHFTRERWLFGLSVAVAIGVGLIATGLLGSARPSWTCLTVVLVLRSEATRSTRLAIERVVGTLAGVVAATLLVRTGDHRLMVVAMTIAAFVRWPAQQIHNAVGVGCLTLFVLMMVELSSPSTTQALGLFGARFIDTVIGALAAGLGLALYQVLMRLLPTAR